MSERLFVKVCGITRSQDAELAVELGASAIGFVFWPGSPRYVQPAGARKIVQGLAPDVAAIGVFVDQPPAYVAEVADEVGLAVIQLHGSESSEYCAQLHRSIIKAIAFGGAVDLNRYEYEYDKEILILLDAHDRAQHGGTGRTIDWHAAREVALSRPTILSGGLNPDNVARAIETVRPYGIDVSSGVESRPGIKDSTRLRAFFSALPSAPVKLEING